LNTGWRRHENPARVEGGFSKVHIYESHLWLNWIYDLESALSNPNTTRPGRRHAKNELRLRVRPEIPGRYINTTNTFLQNQPTHVSLMTKIKRTLGIRSTPRRNNLLSTSY
jgi:hypothetical protein